MESIRTRRIVEGTTELVVPESTEPLKYPSFFNPQGRFVRDISIVCYKVFTSFFSHSNRGQELSFADCLSGTGARGIRVANEVLEFDRVFLNDISPVSIELAKIAARQNGVEEKCVFSQGETCAFLTGRAPNAGERFDVVDLDPFGTPSPFVDDALRATKHGGLLSVSATDTAVLCGVYPSVAQRKYLGLPLRTDYAHEVGLRLMYGLLALTAMRSETSIRPLFAHHDKHYFRVYCIVEIGNSYSRQNNEKIGYVLHCFKCGSRRIISRDAFFNDIPESLQCTYCDNKSVKVGGPLWIGELQSKEFVDNCSKLSNFPIFRAEPDLPLYYDISTLADEMELPTPRLDNVISELNSIGHLASRTRLNPNAVRTDSPLPALRKVLLGLCR